MMNNLPVRYVFSMDTGASTLAPAILEKSQVPQRPDRMESWVWMKSVILRRRYSLIRSVLQEI